MAYYPGLKEVKFIYATVKTNELISISQHVVSAIAIVLIFKKIIDAYKSSFDGSTGQPNMKSFLNLIYEYGFFLVIIVGLPYIIKIVEAVLGSIEAKALGVLGDAPREGFEVVKRDLNEFQKTYKEGVSFWSPIPVIFNYLLCFIINPLVSFVFTYMYSGLAIMRYMYLLMLEIVAPIAIVCLLSEKTQHYFQAWLKNMFVCYMMLPIFMLAIAFGTVASSAAVLGGFKFDIFSMFFQICLQYKLISFGTRKLNQLI